MRIIRRYLFTLGVAVCFCIGLHVVLFKFSFYHLLIRDTDSQLVEGQPKDFPYVDLKAQKWNVSSQKQIKGKKKEKGNIFTNIEEFLVPGISGVQISAAEFYLQEKPKTGNKIIDDYGKNDPGRIGEMGRGVTFVGHEKQSADFYMNTLFVNVLASDLIPLNRLVPDSRPPKCIPLKYPNDLPTASVVITFHNEWPSVLLRTVYSIINRTPRHLLRDIVLVDDASDKPELKGPLDEYVSRMFPKGLVKLIHLTKRTGLAKARLIGWKEITGDVLVIFDAHMEVNTFWLEPLLYEIKKDRKIIALGTLDYINAGNFEYEFKFHYQTRYGFNWRLVFFETYFRPDVMAKLSDDAPKEGVITVGTGFAVDSKFFQEIGAYDDGMETWGGENIELGWRVWMCGGRMVHLPCSHIGHMPRSQPYSFPKGRKATELYNYKRAVELWMEPAHKEIVYAQLPDMKDLPHGDLSKRIELKQRLQCKNFTWFMHTVWPELTVFPEDAIAWGSISNKQADVCLDHRDFLFQYTESLYTGLCDVNFSSKLFSLKKNNELRASLQCVIVINSKNGPEVKLGNCYSPPPTKWIYKEKTGQLLAKDTELCLDLDADNTPVMSKCSESQSTQKWTFQFYNGTG